ncbi:MAG: hypothetical protein DWQ10_00375 [Calditrichaeota bacterium]|nr:MAG: hypothetical protein DWQ10_00375 [Calditrichota bacterium]
MSFYILFITLFGFVPSFHLLAQSETIFWGKIYDQTSGIVSAEQVDLNLYTTHSPDVIYKLNNFGCGFYNEMAIFWVTTGKISSNDTLILKIHNSVTTDSIVTGIVLKDAPTRIINLGEFSFDGNQITDHFLVSPFPDSSGSGETTRVDNRDHLNEKEQYVSHERIQPFPNPFNPSLHRFITLPIPSHAKSPFRTYIYDIHGTLVWRHDFRFHDLGKRAVFWNGKNLHGQTVASGTYISVIQSDTSDTRALITLVR